MIVIDHTHYKVRVDSIDTFITAAAAARALLLNAPGYRNFEITRGTENKAEPSVCDVRMRIEWRSAADYDGFVVTDRGRAFASTLRGFEAIACRVEERLDFDKAPARFEAKALRSAFSHYPTGVAAITAKGDTGPLALVVSSFTSVSLDPVLVSFYASHTSTTWPHIANAGFCCVNILAESQQDLSKKLAAKGDNRFDAVTHRPAPESGSPILDGVVAWFDCRIIEVRIAGDHDWVLLEVLAHENAPEVEPLVFHRSSYRQFPR